MKLIKNNTPYLGKIKLKFEKYPEYTGSSILNKVHLNLGFTKLVSRLTPNYLKETGREVDPKKVRLINTHTDGKIGTYESWVVKGVDGSFKSLVKPKDERDIIDHMILNNSFLSQKGDYIGSIEDGWWYYKTKMTVCDKHPHGVALVWKDGQLFGYYGYTHRGGQVFVKGDRLFDMDYIPKEEDYPEWQWAGFVEKFDKLYEKSDELDKKWMDEDGISSVIPFKLRGKDEIESDTEAIQAAINVSKYLS